LLHRNARNLEKPVASAWGGLFMRHIFFAAALALSGCATSASTSPIVRTQVMDVSQRIAGRYASTWNADDMAAFGALYAADARHVTLAGEFLRGRSQIVAAHRASRARYAEGVRMATRLEGARAITDDAIVAVMILEYVNAPGAAGRVQSARLTLTLARREGEWRIAQAQASDAN
jgi:uncharacterized protein (TIGR02246 family)